MNAHTPAFVPRWYQTESVQTLFDFLLNKPGNPVIALPTGTGKSAVIGMFIHWALYYYPFTRALILTHVQELIEQDKKALDKVWPGNPATIFSAGLGVKDPHSPIVFGGVQSVGNAVDLFGWRDFVIIDEAHLVGPEEGTKYQAIIGRLREINPNLRVIGLTATPWRHGLGYITENGIFTDIVYDLTTPEGFARLISERHLSPLFPKKTVTQLSTEGVKLSGGDYVQSQLQEAVDKDEITYAALREMVERAYDRTSWLVFASGVDHAEHIANAFGYFGIPATAIHSKISKSERAYRLDAFRSGAFRVAVNNNVLTTGFDHPPIDLIGILRPTMSAALWVQMLGRGTRPSPETYKSNCLVMDFAGNTNRLGPIDDPIIPKRKGPGGGEAPIKICPVCDGYNHPRAAFCIQCGAAFEFKPNITGTSSDAELLRAAETVTEIFPVDSVLYSKHEKKRRPEDTSPPSPPTLKVSYRCGLTVFNEYICFEHTGFPRNKAANWWMQRSANDTPATVDEALAQREALRKPQQINVWTSARHPEILGYQF